MGRVWDADLPPNLKLVLLAYADAAEHDGTEIWPGWDRVAAMTGYSEPTVARITAELRKLGVLVQVQRGFTGQRSKYLIDLSHPSLRAYQDDMQSESESLSNDRESLSNDRESLSLTIPLPSYSPVLTSHPSSEATLSRDLLWESVVAIHGDPANRSERGKFNRAVKLLREANVTPDEYPALVQAYCARYDKLQPAVMTVASRVGEMRHFVAKGPIRSVSLDQVADAQWLASKDRKALA